MQSAFLRYGHYFYLGVHFSLGVYRQMYSNLNVSQCNVACKVHHIFSIPKNLKQRLFPNTRTISIIIKKYSQFCMNMQALPKSGGSLSRNSLQNATKQQLYNRRKKQKNKTTALQQTKKKKINNKNAKIAYHLTWTRERQSPSFHREIRTLSLMGTKAMNRGMEAIGTVVSGTQCKAR